MNNIVTWTEYGGSPTGWHRAEWVTRSPGIRAIRYETDFDLTCLFRNIAIAGGLATAWRDGQTNGIAWWRGMEVRKDGP